MGMAFFKARRGYLNEIPVLLQLVYGFTAAVAHALAEPRHELVHIGQQFPLVGYPAFNALGPGILRPITAWSKSTKTYLFDDRAWDPAKLKIFDGPLFNPDCLCYCVRGCLSGTDF